MNKYDYKNYLKSADWLIFKNKIINDYLKQKWNICCSYCEKKYNLELHHINYRSVGLSFNKKYVEDFCFLCHDCHRRLHFENGFKDKMLEESIENIP